MPDLSMALGQRNIINGALFDELSSHESPSNSEYAASSTEIIADAPPQLLPIGLNIIIKIIKHYLSSGGESLMNQDVIISCAVTGDDTKVTKSPHCAITPEQIAATAIAAAQAGAAIVHIHVREPETGEFSMETRHYREVVKRIRESKVDVIVNLTCGMGGYIVVCDEGLKGTPGLAATSSARKTACVMSSTYAMKACTGRTLQRWIVAA